MPIAKQGSGIGHPGLTLTSEGVSQIKANMDAAPIFVRSVEQAKKEVSLLMADGVLVPIPKDMAGGYSHEIHKRNFLVLPKAAALYQITGDEKYAEFTKDVFMAYAKMFPTLGKHPSTRSYAPGKIFWQCLNDANWLVYMSQAYDCIYNYLSEEERDFLENDLFKPFCDYISIENPQFFNRIHNHSTWGNAGVGMMALAMDDDELLNRALYGISNADISSDAIDNDGGVIKISGQSKAGFLAQLDHSFSPEGYYSEGPYYQRYAMSPFISFAQALANKKPELEIFKYRNSLLEKALFTLLQLTDSRGQFYAINDAQKGMSYLSRELIAAVDVVYSSCGNDPTLLSVAQEQNTVQLDLGGYQVAKAISDGKAQPFLKKSMAYSDGAEGDDGGISILRSSTGENDFNLLFKYAAQGMGHGHFDRLAYLAFDGSTEILQDYGAARWVNIDQKAGGGYLPENKTWAKQTIAHNTLVVDDESHFRGSTREGSKHSSIPYYFNSDNENVQISSAKDTSAYPGVEMQRTLCLLKDDEFENPIIIDLFRANSDKKHNYKLPFHFATQFMGSSLSIKADNANLAPMGEKHGYQHIWQESETEIDTLNYNLTWYSDNKFYTATSLSTIGDEIIMARIGANDPNFNLRRDAFYIHQKQETNNALFATMITSHGSYSTVSEIPSNPYPKDIAVHSVLDNNNYSIVKFELPSGKSYVMMVANQDKDKNAVHKHSISNETYEWQGPVQLKIYENE